MKIDICFRLEHPADGLADNPLIINQQNNGPRVGGNNWRLRRWTHVLIHGVPPGRNSAIRLGAIRDSGKICRAAPIRAAAFGMPYTKEESRSCAVVETPESRSRLRPAAPSLPMPVSNTAAAPPLQ